MLNIISIFIGGGCGAFLRYLTGIIFLKTLHANLPFATFTVNIAGGFLIGFLYILFIDKPEINTAMKLALTTGLCGGLTTFSTFSLEIFDMINNHQYTQAFTYALLSVIISLVAVGLGAYCAKYF